METNDDKEKYIVNIPGVLADRAQRYMNSHFINKSSLIRLALARFLDAEEKRELAVPNAGTGEENTDG